MYMNLEVLRKPFRPINNELRFELFCSLINMKKSTSFFKKRPTDHNPICFWIVTVLDWTQIGVTTAV